MNMPVAPDLVGDERALRLMAEQLNAEGRIADHGLMGTRGRFYGPVPVWIWQGLLHFSDQTLTLRYIQTAFITLLTLAGILLLTHALKGLCSFEEVATIFLIPEIWHFSRTLWDNPILIPVSLLAVGSYLCFTRFQNNRWLVATALFCSLCLNIHLMALALIAALATHFLVFHWRLLLEKKKLIALSLAVFAIPLIPYLRFFFTHGGEPGGVQANWFAYAWEQLYLGFWVVSPGALKFGIGLSERTGGWLSIGELIGFGFGAAGLFWSTRQRLRLLPEISTYVSQVWFLSVLVIGFALAMQIAARLFPTVHYYHASWVGYELAILLAWIRLRNSAWGEIAKLLFIVCNAIAISSIHYEWTIL